MNAFRLRRCRTTVPNAGQRGATAGSRLQSVFTAFPLIPCRTPCLVACKKEFSISGFLQNIKAIVEMEDELVKAGSLEALS